MLYKSLRVVVLANSAAPKPTSPVTPQDRSDYYEMNPKEASDYFEMSPKETSDYFEMSPKETSDYFVMTPQEEKPHFEISREQPLESQEGYVSMGPVHSNTSANTTTSRRSTMSSVDSNSNYMPMSIGASATPSLDSRASEQSSYIMMAPSRINSSCGGDSHRSWHTSNSSLSSIAEIIRFNSFSQSEKFKLDKVKALLTLDGSDEKNLRSNRAYSMGSHHTTNLLHSTESIQRHTAIPHRARAFSLGNHSRIAHRLNKDDDFMEIQFPRRAASKLDRINSTNAPASPNDLSDYLEMRPGEASSEATMAISKEHPDETPEGYTLMGPASTSPASSSMSNSRRNTMSGGHPSSDSNANYMPTSDFNTYANIRI